MTIHVISIGVNRSLADRSIPRLNYAEIDASANHRLWSEDLGCGDNAKLLVDAPSFQPHVRQAVDEVGRRVVAGDTFVLYFAGHGKVINGEPFCLLSQAEIAPLEAGRTDSNDLLSISWLRQRVRTSWPRGVHLACIIDACRTEIRTGTRGGGGMSELRKQLEGYASRDPRIVQDRHAAGLASPDDSDVGDIELYACPLGEQSHEFDPIGRGMVSFALENWLREGLLKGLPRVLDESLSEVLERGVDEIAREHRRPSPGQRPVIQRNGAPVLLFNPGGMVVRLTRSQQDAVDGYEAHLAAGELNEPVGNCARDSLFRLYGMALPAATMKELAERLQNASAEAQARKDAAHDADLLARARRQDSQIGWTLVEFQARLPATREEARRRIAELNEPPPPPPPDPADEAFRALGGAPPASACRDFLNRFANSLHAAGVGRTLNALDDAAWAEAAQRATESALDRYLTEWPGGLHRDDAQRAIAQLQAERERAAAEAAEAAARREREAREDDDWARAQAAGSSQAYQQIIQAWPAGRYAKDAERLLDQALKEEARRAEEETDWAAARQLDSIEGYRQFLNRWGAGRFAAEANRLQRAILDDDIAWARAHGAGTRQALKAYLDAWEAGRHKVEALDAVASLDAEESRLQAQQDGDWNHALQAGTAEALETFANRWPAHQKSASARQRAQEMRADERQAELAQEDDAAWRGAQQASTKEAFAAYLDAWKEGRHASEARKEMARLDAAEEEQNKLDADWRLAHKTGTAVAFEAFANKWPGSANAAGARQSAADLRKAAQTEREQADWAKARHTDTVDGYRQFLECWGSGLIADEARHLQRAIQDDDSAWERAQQVGTTAAFRAYLDTWKPGRHASEAQSAIAEAHAQEKHGADWRLALETSTAETFEAFASKWPRSPNAAWARQRAAELRRGEKKDSTPNVPQTPEPFKKQSSTPTGVLVGTGMTAALVVAALIWKPFGAPTPPPTVEAASPDPAPVIPVPAPTAQAPAPAATKPPPQPDAEALRASYAQARKALLANPWWAGEGITKASAAPTSLVPVLELAQQAAAADVDLGLMDYGLARIYGHGAALDRSAGAADLLRFMAAPARKTSGDDNFSRAIDAIDDALSADIKAGAKARSWSAPLAILQSMPEGKPLPTDYWRGVVLRCLVQPMDRTAAEAALQRGKRMPDSTLGSAKLYRQLADDHLVCLQAGRPCGQGCDVEKERQARR